jgi:3-oxoacyl-(acyl-carrier-protein) synthase
MNTPVITGAGVVSAVAHTPAALHEALCSGVQAPRPLPAVAGAQVPCELGAVVDQDTLARELSDRPVAGIDRIGQLTIVAARRALASAMPNDAGHSLGLVLGTMFAGAHTIGEFDRRAQTAGPQFASPLDFANTVLNAAAGQAAIRLSLRGPNVTISAGHTSGLQAIGYAADLVSRERAEVLLAGGADELSLESYLGYARAGMLCGTNGRPGHIPVPFDCRRTGLALGEGAAFVVVERAEAARRRGARVHAIVAGHATGMDPDALERGRCGRAVIATVIQEALSRAGVAGDAVDGVSASANGSYDADAEEAAALAQVFGARSRPPAVTAIKSVLGEALGAAGPLQVISAVEAMGDGRFPGIRGLEDPEVCAAAGVLCGEVRHVRLETVLVTAVSPEGNCCAVVLRRPEDIP